MLPIKLLQTDNPSLLIANWKSLSISIDIIHDSPYSFRLSILLIHVPKKKG
jgi:hypothetical protein